MKSTHWEPILTGSLHEKAWMIIDDIAAALEAVSAQRPQRSAERFAAEALLRGYLARARPSARHQERCHEAHEQAFEAVASTRLGFALHGGFTFVGWVSEHLDAMKSDAPGADEEDTCEALDDALIGLLRAERWAYNYDLISGLVGIGVYALERLPRPAAHTCLERVVDHLLAIAEHTPEGVTWRTRPELMPPKDRQAWPGGYYNLGVAHGVPGVIALLAAARSHGVAAGRVEPVLASAVRWLLSRRLPASTHSAFDYHTDRAVSADSQPPVRGNGARAAWCYGDPGVAAALLAAGRSCGEDLWVREAIEIGHRAANRPAETREVVDGGLCHGAAGLGHLFNRMYQATGEEVFLREARASFELLLDMRRPGDGVAGYSALFPRDRVDDGWEDNASLLTGAAGIALAFLAATSDIEPAWDRVLMASIRPAPPAPANASDERQVR